MAKFTRSELRSILGEAHTEEIENKLIALHLGVVDPLKDDLQKAQADAAKLQDVQKELDTLKSGTNWKDEHDKLKKQFDDYKASIDSKEKLGKVQAAYRKLLDAKKINSDDADLIMAGTKFDGMTLKDDGTLDKADDLTKDIETRFKRYIPTTDTRGAHVDNPPGGDNGGGANPRAAEIAKQFHERRYGKAPATDGANDNK